MRPFLKNMNLNDFISLKQFSLDRKIKSKLLVNLLAGLHQHHYLNSRAYKKICDILFPNVKKIKSLSDLPFIPVSLFKTQVLKSIPDNKVYKILTSSGTTESVPSRIYLDVEMAKLQTDVLFRIMAPIFGNERLPMLIVDSKNTVKDRKSFSARGAGILGFSVFGKDHCFLLNDRLEIDTEALDNFLAKFNGHKMLIFGFTFMIWKYLYLTKLKQKINLQNAILVHSGGWKKMEDLAVDNAVFKRELNKKYGLKKIYNFYGMVEQIGSIFIENEDSYLQCSNFSDIIIRNPKDFSVQPIGKEGLVQVISVLPKSYPGHSILTDDIGVCVGEDNSTNGWKGKYFKILRRVENADLRGCSNTFD